MALSSRHATELRLRRMLAESAGRRLRLRPGARIPHQEWPRAARAAYFIDLKSMLVKLRDVTESRLFPELPRLLGQFGPVRLDAADDFKGELERLTPTIDQISGEHIFKVIARKTADRTAAHNKEQVNKQFRAVLGIDLLHNEPQLLHKVELFTVDNVRLIKGLSDDSVQRMRGLVMKAARTGVRVEDLRDQIQDGFETSFTRAGFLARDQIGKFNGELTRLRQESVGVDEYIWDTSKDERVRPDHAALDGSKQSWSDPPLVDSRSGRHEHPGGDYNCRCSALPVLDEILAKLAA